RPTSRLLKKTTGGPCGAMRVTVRLPVRSRAVAARRNCEPSHAIVVVWERCTGSRQSLERKFRRSFCTGIVRERPQRIKLPEQHHRGIDRDDSSPFARVSLPERWVYTHPLRDKLVDVSVHRGASSSVRRIEPLGPVTLRAMVMRLAPERCIS